MNSPEPEELYQEAPRFGVRQWMSARWWIALVFSVTIIFVIRSGTVGAPAQASARSLDSLPDFHGRRTHSTRVEPLLIRRHIDLEEQLRSVSIELEHTRSVLALERSKADLLKEGYDGLDARFQEVVELVQSSIIDPESEIASPRVPTPIDAIYVIGKGPSDTADASSPQRP